MNSRSILPVALVLLIFSLNATGQGIATRSVLIAGGTLADKPPMISSEWGEGCFYNAGCPNDTASHATCLHVPAGAGAVAMAQIMRYWGHPAHGTGEHGYQHPVYGIQYANFGMTNYNWSAMPDSLLTVNDGLATLIYQCGVAQNMNYGTSASTSLPDDIDSALVKYFGYAATASWKSRQDYTGADWITLLKAELDASRPVLYSGTDSTGQVRHYFICDGYVTGDLFHFNWGWNGTYDGYFQPDVLKPGTSDFSFNQRAMTGITPQSVVSGNVTMDFENIPDFSLTFSNWTVNDEDQHSTYGITGYSFPHQTEPMAFLCFNPAQMVPSMASDQAIQPHGGQRFGACFSSNPPANSDWFISPQVQLGLNGTFSFWVKSYNDLYGLDNYTVAVSTTNTDPGSFTVISGTQPLQTTTSWVNKTFDLSAYNDQKVYIAIHCVSNDHFLMMIDDILVKPQASTTLTADFSADKTSIRIGETVNFTDKSTGGPVTWEWKFSGGTPSASTLQNPSGIKYTAPGSYLVSLKVSNGTASDSVTRAAYISVTGYNTYLTLDFESLPDFSMNFFPWTLIDVGGGNTYGIQAVTFPNNYQPMAYICFNPSQTSPPLVNMQPHSGARLGCSFSSSPPYNPNNKWLITPKMSLGLNPQIEMWVMTYNNQFGDERYNVCVSTTGNTPASFTSLTASPEAAPVGWTKRTYSLSNYTNQDVYIGIQCVTNDGFIFMIDDISITSSLGIGEPNPLDRVVVYPNPATDLLTISIPGSSAGTVTAGMSSILGERVLSVTELPVSGRILLDVHDIPTGVYLLRLRQGAFEVVRIISVIHQ